MWFKYLMIRSGVARIFSVGALGALIFVGGTKILNWQVNKKVLTVPAEQADEQKQQQKGPSPFTNYFQTHKSNIY